MHTNYFCPKMPSCNAYLDLKEWKYQFFLMHSRYTSRMRNTIRALVNQLWKAMSTKIFNVHENMMNWSFYVNFINMLFKNNVYLLSNIYLNSYVIFVDEHIDFIQFVFSICRYSLFLFCLIVLFSYKYLYWYTNWIKLIFSPTKITCEWK